MSQAQLDTYVGCNPETRHSRFKPVSDEQMQVMIDRWNAQEDMAVAVVQTAMSTQVTLEQAA